MGMEKPLRLGKPAFKVATSAVHLQLCQNDVGLGAWPYLVYPRAAQAFSPGKRAHTVSPKLSSPSAPCAVDSRGKKSRALVLEPSSGV